MRQGGVEQVVRPRPDVDEDQRPEVDDGEAVGIHRTLRRFRDEIIHDPEDRGGEEESDGVVAVPPLHQRVLHAAEERVGMGQRGGDGEVVDDVEQRDGDNRRDVEPKGNVEGFLIPFREGPEEVGSEHDPDDNHRDVDGPDELRVFLAAAEAGGKRDRGGKNDELPAPEMDRGKEIRGRAAFAQALGGIVNTGEDHVTHKGEDHRIGMQRTDATEGDVGQAFCFKDRKP